MGRYIANTLERQQELGIKLDNAVILKGVTDGLGKEAKMTDEEIQKVLQQYDAKINELTKAKAEKDAVEHERQGDEQRPSRLRRPFLFSIIIRLEAARALGQAHPEDAGRLLLDTGEPAPD